ncbi:efflux RND transporter periplasmic adaptor subunit [Rhodopirellula sp. SWK7]|uniref:efflux RND transporter periplasmic adaptor subunit n=1 Tax=Rhodopirellula sp. SWK7 TaxID=595460 RepID=UPI0002BD7DDB|nr:efflux RND transporter periplasmic adaptor subunit [Rhodopirellula sp. SWK7]EMI41343.1 metal transport-related, exported protein [Rhodopirellula sp. SWK7]
MSESQTDHEHPQEPRDERSSSREGNPPATKTLSDRLARLKWLGRTVTHASVILLVFIGGIALIGVAQRLDWIQRSGDAASGDGSHVHDGETIYTCPMHPQIRQNEPGDCPICGMKLVPTSTSAKTNPTGATDDRYICPMMCTPPSSEPGRCPVCAMELVKATGGGGGDGVSVTIEPVARRLIGIQTAKAKQGPVTQTIRTIGSISYDESKLATISAYVGGRIEKLYANYVGVPVEKDDDLALIYSPDLYSAQVEFLTAQSGGGLKRLGGSSDFQELAKQKLIELGFTDEQVANLRSRGKAESRMRLRSPIKGTVIDKFAVEGDYLKTGDEVYRIADLSTVWLMLDLYPDDASRIRFGQQVKAEVSSTPGRVHTGRVAFIDPTVNEKTRTVRVRVEMLNTDGKLRPGDYATARIDIPAIHQDILYDPSLAGKYISPMHPQIIRNQPGECPICGMDLIPTSQLGFADAPLPQQNVVTVPRDAVLMTGDTSVVYVETEPGRFEIRRVSVGPMTDDRAVIIEGITAGETIATHGNFLIDSQMQLAGNPSLMDPRKASSYPPGPLELTDTPTTVLSGQSGELFDNAYAAYFEIQKTLASDRAPDASVVGVLRDSLTQLSSQPDLPKRALSHVQRAQQSLERMNNSLERTREGFRVLSHALLRTAAIVRGPQTADKLYHMFCPMVPGGGGDWMQRDSELINPYWGSEMLSCGELVKDMSIAPLLESQRK